MISISIVTISHFSRHKFLAVLAKCIKNQDCDRNMIIEWIIVDTSSNGYYPSENDLQEFVEEIRKDSLFPKIVYHKSTKKTIGAWRNESNKLVTGDIVICMDDDDYYPPQRISHAVNMLGDKKALIAGCDKILFFDIHFNKFYQFKGFSSNHSTNNCMAYWRQYLENHNYDESVLHAEENSFTNNFTEPMIQLEAKYTILQFSHDSNTYNKKRIIYQNYFLDTNAKYIFEMNETVEHFINNSDIYNNYCNIFDSLKKPKECQHDIVYFTGGYSILWSPLQNDLGGSEQAIKYLTTEWVREGKKVAVYGNLGWEGNYNGVDYFNYLKFRFWDKFKTLILWRMFGSYPYITFNLAADKILVDVHDHLNDYYSLLIQNQKNITHWMLKSEFHHSLIRESIGQEIKNAVIIPNGVRISDFSNTITESRNPFRMCYCSCYTRGLHRILKNIWPTVHKLEPRAELHVYYGMDFINDENYKNEMKILLSQPGIMDHGKQSTQIINREKHMSTYHLYYTDTLAEIDCISIKESLVAGCIPIISNIHVFKYRDGIHLRWLPNTPDFNHQIACTLVELMNNNKTPDELRTQFYKSKSIISWQQCANEWLKYIC